MTAGPDLLADAVARFGAARFCARGTSMAPAIRSGDVLEVEKCSADQLRPGDVLVVRDGERLLAHRLVARGPMDPRQRVVTRGDAHWRADPPLPSTGVVGRVVAVTRNGRLLGEPGACTPVARVRGLVESQCRSLVRSLRGLLTHVLRQLT